MDFAFTQEQQLLRDSVRKVLAAMPLAGARNGGADPSIATKAWQLAAELGWPALAVPEDAGGLGMGPVEAAVVGEEMGRSLFAASYRDTAILLPTLLAHPQAGPLRGMYEELCAGTLHVALAHLEPDGDWMAESACTVAQGRLHGRKVLVEHAHAATHFLVLGRRSGLLDVSIVPANAKGVSLSARQPLDITCGLADVTFDAAEVLCHASLPVDAAEMTCFDNARLFNCAELNGAAEAALQMSLAYVRERKQFGQAIGSFQAVKHRLADAFVMLENAKSATYYAAIALQDGMPDAGFALDAAQAASCEMAVRVTSDCIQVHGGIGFTWEYDLHLYFKRARRLVGFLGGAQLAHRRIAESLV